MENEWFAYKKISFRSERCVFSLKKRNIEEKARSIWNGVEYDEIKWNESHTHWKRGRKKWIETARTHKFANDEKVWDCNI